MFDITLLAKDGNYTELEQKLYDEVVFVQAVLNTVLDAIIAINHQGIICSFNPAAEKMFGYSHKEVIGKNIKILMPDNHAFRHDSYINNHLHTGYSSIIGRSRELMARRKDGREFSIELGINRFALAGQVMFVGSIRDISLRKQNEEELRQHKDNLEQLIKEQYHGLILAKERAEDANIAKTEFLSSLSHELRTPMHAILNYAHMGLKQAGQEDVRKVTKYFANIHTAGTRLLGVLNNLLDLVKLESEQLALEIKSCNMLEIIDIALQELESLLNQKGLKVKKSYSTDNPIIQCDRARMIQVVINLLSNAIKFSPEKHNIYIELSNWSNEYICLRVVDEGQGIPANELDAIFEKFVQSSRTGAGLGGTGLGLAICRDIVMLHDGKIWAENGYPRGSVFNVVLPRYALCG
jgi:two-component system, LuxR family, sensor kinase FixL